MSVEGQIVLALQAIHESLCRIEALLIKSLQDEDEDPSPTAEQVRVYQESRAALRKAKP